MTLLLTDILNELKYSQDKDWWVTIDPSEFKHVDTKQKLYKLLKGFVKERNPKKYKLTIEGIDFNKGINRILKLLRSGKAEIQQIAINPMNNDVNTTFDISIQLRDINPDFMNQMNNDKFLD